MPEWDDNDIIEGIKSPDKAEAAFSQLVQKYQERLYWHIRKIVISHEDADDVMQNTMVKVWRSLDNFRVESSLFTWLYRIGVNAGYVEKVYAEFFARPDSISDEWRRFFEEHLAPEQLPKVEPPAPPAPTTEAPQELSESKSEVADKRREVHDMWVAGTEEPGWMRSYTNEGAQEMLPRDLDPAVSVQRGVTPRIGSSIDGRTPASAAMCGAAKELPVATVEPRSFQAIGTSTPQAPNSTGGRGL